jgi:hypothetical protein
MTDNALMKKLKLKAGQRAAVIHAPSGYLDTLQPLPEGVALTEALDGTLDWIQLFLKTQAELAAIVPTLLESLGPATLVWFCFPKGTSKIQTDLTRDDGWDALKGTELKWVTLISVNDTWSAFAVRPYKPGEPRQSFR